MIALLLAAVPARAQFLNVTQIGNLDEYGSYSDVWGWAGLDTLGNPVELAIVGTFTGTTFIDATVPSAPVEVAFFPGPNTSWRDIKTYRDHAYIVNEGGSGLQIVDLSDPLDPVLVANNTTFFTTAHNVYVDTTAALLYAAGTDAPGMVVLSLADPAAPALVANFGTYYVHDVYARDGVAYCAAVNDGYLVTVNTSVLPLTPIMDQEFSVGVFTHNTWLTDDGDFCLTTDEISGGRVQVWDVSDPADIFPVTDIGDFADPDVIVHNAIVLGDFAYVSWYKRGMVVLDVSDPYFPQHVGYYDTFPGSGNGFDGAWGVYPFSPSGTIYVSDISTGFYALEFEPDFGRVGGTVTDAVSGDSLGAVTCRVTDTGNTVATLDTGRYRFSLVPDAYTLVFEAFGYLPDTILVAVAADSLLTVDVALQPVPQGDVAGTVREAGSYALLPGVDVVLRGTPLGATTDSSGAFLFSPVPAGAYWLVCEEFGYAPDSVQVVVPASGTAEHDLILLPSVHVDDLETDLGWTVGAPGDLAFSGIWQRGDPVGTGGGLVQPEDDHTEDPGVIAWITGNTGGGVGDNDVDGGRTTLVSPVVDLSGLPAATLRVHYWHSNDAGAAPGTDDFRIEVSDDGGTVWQNLLTTKQSTGSAWKAFRYPLDTIIDLTATVRFRFIAEDIAAGSLVEAGVDDLDIYGDPAQLAAPGPASRAPVAVLPAAPNPFLAETRLAFDLTARQPVQVDVFDVQGRRVARLLERVLDPGRHEVVWDGRGDDGRRASAGLYFLRLRAPGGGAQQKVVLGR